MDAAGLAELLIPAPRLIEPLGPGHLELPERPRCLGFDGSMVSRLVPGSRLAGPGDDGADVVLERRSPRAGAPAGAYRLTVDGPSRRVVICAAEAAGVRHGLVTLGQMLRGGGPRLPHVRITDEPALATRGLMLDVSRDKVPTLASLIELADRMESLKLNHLQLYTEHTFAYSAHAEAWAGSSPLTPAEIRELDRTCVERGIELAANQNCFGHLHRWLRLPRYAPLAEIEGAETAWTFETDDGRAFTKHGPHSLCPTDPRSLELIGELLDELLPCFTSGLVNIGCDEAFDVGQGRSRSEVAARGRAALYFEHVRGVDAIVKRHGKRSLFWADIALREPSSLSLAPEGAGALAWGYEGDTPFDQWSQTLERAGLERWFCPGTSCWLSMTGRTRNRHENLDGAARAAAAGGGAPMLTCAWGDRGHRQHWPVTLHAVAHAAHAAWRGEAGSFPAAAAGRQILDDRTGRLGAWLEALGDADRGLSRGLRNTNAIVVELHRPLAAQPTDAARVGSLEEWAALRARLADLRDEFESFRGGLDALVAEELAHTLHAAEHAADKGVVCRAALAEPGGVPRGPARIRLAADLGSIIEEHRGLWTRRNRPGGLDDSAAHYERVVDDYEHPGPRAGTG
ncbi:MAG: family 20 glycosylhydrolase [Planctomycetota bacterium]|nr:family 20 glycosylhydrolase [Planctomycetota bacterium]